MSDWQFLNAVRIKGPNPSGVPPRYWSTDEMGFNGMFEFTADNYPVRVLASDGRGWQHVSVSIRNSKKCPPWGVMCAVKELFWEPEDWVIQFHPAQSCYVNFHPGCLHLWKPVGQSFPVPDAIMVGPLQKTIDKSAAI